MNEEYSSTSVENCSGLYEKLKSVENNITLKTILDCRNKENEDNCIKESGKVNYDEYTQKTKNHSTSIGAVSEHDHDSETIHNAVSDVRSHNSTETDLKESEQRNIELPFEASDNTQCDKDLLEITSNTADTDAEFRDSSSHEAHETSRNNKSDNSGTENENRGNINEKINKLVGNNRSEKVEKNESRGRIDEKTSTSLVGNLYGSSSEEEESEKLNNPGEETKKSLVDDSYQSDEEKENDSLSHTNEETSLSVADTLHKDDEVEKNESIGHINEESSTCVADTSDQSEEVSAELFHEIVDIDDDDTVTCSGTVLPETEVSTANQTLKFDDINLSKIDASGMNQQSSQLEVISVSDSDETSDSDTRTIDVYWSLSDQSENESSQDSQNNSKVELAPPSKIEQSSKWCPQINNITSIQEGNDNVVRQISPPTFVAVNSIKTKESRTNGSTQDIPTIDIDDEDSLNIDKEFKLIDVTVRVPKLDDQSIAKLTKGNVTEMLPKTKLPNLRKIETICPRKKTDSKLCNSSMEVTNNKRHVMNRKNRKENIRRRKFVKYSCDSRSKFKSDKSNLSRSKRKHPDSERSLSDRRSLRLLGIAPDKYDLPENKRIVKNGEERHEVVRKFRSAVKRSLSPHNETIRAKRIKATKEIRKCEQSSSTVQKKVTFLLNERKSLKETNATFAKIGKDRSCDIRENESSNRKKNEVENVTNNAPIPKAQSKNRQLPISNYLKTVDVWYECDCCSQKYLLLEQIKEHVRSHFPDYHTS